MPLSRAKIGMLGLACSILLLAAASLAGRSADSFSASPALSQQQRH